MSKFIKDFTEKNKPQFIKYKEYISSNDWRTKFTDEEENPAAIKAKFKSPVQLKRDEFVTQNNLVNIIIDRLKYFVAKTQADQHTKGFKDLVKTVFDIVDLHKERVDNYIAVSDISDIKNTDLRTEEIDFHSILFKAVSSIDDTVLALNIKEDADETAGISFYNNMKAPLSMHEVLTGGENPMFPEVIRVLEVMKIDFTSPPKNEMHIHNPNPPKWNPEKHYWEQDRDTLQYFCDEFKKIKNGINIDGYYISGWMYYHLNVFMTPIPEPYYNENSGKWESRDIIKNPPLRDSEEFVFQNYNLAVDNQVMLFLAATRRAAKTTLLASHLDHAATIGKKELLCAGTSSKDLGQIAKNFKTSIANKNAAFAIFNVSNDWTKEIEIGLKSKNNKTIKLSTLKIVNLEQNNDNKSEVLAGFTPDVFILDEIFKGYFLNALEGLKPALNGAINPKTGTVGKRCTPILSGTGGNDSLGKDAMQVLNFPKENEILDMQWKLLERGVPEEFITWKEDKKTPFGTFIPGQMSVGMPKNTSNLAEFLKINSEKLRKIPIQVTDWEKALKVITERREAKMGNKVSYIKEVVYIPVKPSEIKISGRVSPFPMAEAKAHRDYLLQTGKWDRRRDIYRDSQGVIRLDVSRKDLAEFPHKGGHVDAPFLIFEDPPKDKVKWGTYTAGFDDYATDDSDTDSVATFYIMKNKILGDEFSEKVVASISFRPQRHPEVYEKWLLLMEAYQLDGTCFGENFNYAIKDFLDRHKLAEKYLASSLTFTESFNLPNNKKRTTGWNPTVAKKTLFNLFVDYCNEEFEVEQEDGTVLFLKGVQRIDDIWLLEEIIQWSENSNVDRITAAMGACGYIHFLNSSSRWRVLKKEEKRTESNKAKPQRPKNFYSSQNRTRNFYRSK